MAKDKKTKMSAMDLPGDAIVPEQTEGQEVSEAIKLDDPPTPLAGPKEPEESVDLCAAAKAKPATPVGRGVLECWDVPMRKPKKPVMDSATPPKRLDQRASWDVAQ